MLPKYLLVVILAVMIMPVTYVFTEEEAEVVIEAGSADANSGKSYAPKTLTVAVGTTVEWENEDSAGHTVTSGNPGDADFGTIFDSGFPLIKPGDSWEHTFDATGTFPYFCQVHPWMTGTIVVEEMPGGNGSPPMSMSATTPSGVKVTLSLPEVIEPGSEVTFKLEFADATGNSIDAAQYDFMLIREEVHITHRSLQSISQGVSMQKVIFKEDQTGSVTLRLENINLTTGENVDFNIQVVPEFPLTIIALTAVFGIMIFSYRYRKIAGSTLG